MKKKNSRPTCVLLFLWAVNLAGAFTVPKHSNERYMSSENTARNIKRTELNLFHPHHNHCSCIENNPQSSGTKSMRIMKRISQRLRMIVLFLAVRFSSMIEEFKRRYIPILAAAMITAGSFPSRSIADMSTKSATMPKISVTNIRTSMDSEVKKSIARNSFLQYDMKAPNNYFEDIDPNKFFDTNIQTVNGINDVLENDDKVFVDENTIDDEFETTIFGSTSQKSTIEVVTQIQETEDDLMVLDDRMLKNGLKNVALVSSGTAGLIVLRRKGARLHLEEDDKDDTVNVDVPVEYGKTSRSASKENIGLFADCEADENMLPPLLHKKYVKARKQPKLPKEEAILAARYAAIPTLEERAYQILIDLGMIEASRKETM